MEEKGLVTLGRFSSAGELAIYQSLLEANGIRVFVTGEYTNDVYPMGETWASIDLQVAAEDEQQAREILTAGFDKEEFKTESAKKPDPEK